MTPSTFRLVHRCCALAVALSLGVGACAPRALVPSRPPAEDLVRVQVLTSADTLARYAWVRAEFDGTPTKITLLRDASGHFVAPIPSGASTVSFTVAVPEHGTLETEAILPTERPATFRIRPRPVFPIDSIQTVRVVGDFNAWNARPEDRLQPGPDGRLRVAIPFSGDSTRFHIRGIGQPTSAAWVPVASYALYKSDDDEASFAGVARPVGDSLRFEVDTANLVYRDRPARIVTVTRDSAIALANTLSVERVDMLQHALYVRDQRPSARDSSRERVIARATALITPGQDARVRGEALVTIISAWTGQERPGDASRMLLAEHGPTSAVLRTRAGVNAIARAVIFAESPAAPTAADSVAMWERIAAQSRAYLLPVARDPRATAALRTDAYFLLSIALSSTKGRTGIDELIAEATAAFPKDENLARLASTFGSQRVLRVGAKFPTFRLAPMGGSGGEITNATFAGKLTLVDFWATWCAPCIEEMPVLHKAYERFKDRGFTILSVSSDESTAPVEALRRRKWPMPWLHAWSGGGLETPTLKAMGVMGLPTAVLVDGEGMVVAVNVGLRGEALERTLAVRLP